MTSWSVRSTRQTALGRRWVCFNCETFVLRPPRIAATVPKVHTSSSASSSSGRTRLPSVPNSTWVLELTAFHWINVFQLDHACLCACWHAYQIFVIAYSDLICHWGICEQRRWFSTFVYIYIYISVTNYESKRRPREIELLIAGGHYNNSTRVCNIMAYT